MNASKRKTAASRSRLGPTCASGSILITLLLGACLNPRPEELPSERDVDTVNVVPDNGGGPVVVDPGASPGYGNDPTTTTGGDDEASPPSPSLPPSAPEGGEGAGAPDAGADGGSGTGTPLTEGDP